jgi:hypothetical protein
MRIGPKSRRKEIMIQGALAALSEGTLPTGQDQLITGRETDSINGLKRLADCRCLKKCQNDEEE